MRPAAHLGTLENRICDGVSTFDDLAALTALMHCLVVDLDTRLAAGETLPTMPPWHVQENKWRSARYGLDAIVILDAACTERLVTDDLADLLVRLEPVAERLGCSAELASVADVVAGGASYQRQRAVAERHRRRPGRGRRLGGARAARLGLSGSARRSRPRARPSRAVRRAAAPAGRRSTLASSATAASASTSGSLVGPGSLRLRLTVWNGAVADLEPDPPGRPALGVDVGDAPGG